jgi:integrase
VSQFHDSVVSEGLAVATANRCLACVKRLFTLAIQWGELEISPARFVKLYRENNARDRVLSAEEIRRLFSSIKCERDRVGALAILFLLATGARCGEALAARWSEISDDGRWTIPRPKAGKMVHKPLNSLALRVVSQLAEIRQGPFLFPGTKPDSHRKSLRSVWLRLCKASQIVGVRQHDIRHTYASILVGCGESLFAVQKLLNHASPSMSKRYAHYDDDTLTKASNKVALFIEATTAGG